jgi:hypothetical protein
MMPASGQLASERDVNAATPLKATTRDNWPSSRVGWRLVFWICGGQSWGVGFSRKYKIMSIPASSVPPPRATSPPARATTATTPAQKCLFQKESDWRPLKPDGSEESKNAAEQANQMLKERLGSLLLSQSRRTTSRHVIC